MGKRGHFTKLERRLIAEALFSVPEITQEERTSSYDCMLSLGMKEEMETLTFRGSLPEIVPAPFATPEAARVASLQNPDRHAELLREYTEAQAKASLALDVLNVPCELDDAKYKHIVAMLNKSKNASVGANVLAGRIGARIAEILDGKYVAPPAGDEVAPTSGEGAQA